MSIASVSGRNRAQRQATNSVPPLNSLSRDGWERVLRAMDLARFGEPREVVSWKWTKLAFRERVAKRMADGEPFPPRSAYETLMKRM